MAGVSTPAMAAAVASAGALGSIGVGATDAAGARAMIAAVRERTTRSLNVNVFCHRPARADAAVEAAWIERLRPEFERAGARAPGGLRAIYRSFVEDDEMLAALVEAKPKVVSFHFGVPSPERVLALRRAGIVLFGTATSVPEGRALAAAGVHAVVAQGYEGGKRGHRGVFDPDAADDFSSAPWRSPSAAGARPRRPGDRGWRHHGWRGHRRRALSRGQRRAARHRVRGLRRVPGERGLPERPGRRRRASHRDDARPLRAPRALPRQPLHRPGRRRLPGRHPRVSHRLRRRQGARRRRPIGGRARLRRAVGRAGRAPLPRAPRGRSWCPLRSAPRWWRRCGPRWPISRSDASWRPAPSLRASVAPR